MKIVLGDFNAKVGREDNFKQTIGNESLHEISNDNEVRVINFGGWTILKWILERQDGMEWIGLIWLRIGTSGGLL
jgi:hypothetical protein